MNDFVFDLDLILKTLDISELVLAKETGIKPASITNWIKRVHEPDPRSMETIYEYAFENGLRINEAHEDPFNKLCESSGLKLLFHGAAEPFKEEVDIRHSKKSNDLGDGFYCGEKYQQSAEYISGYDDSCIYAYGLNMRKLRIYEYQIDTDWAVSVAYHRGLLKKYSDSKLLKQIIKKSANKDVVIAPIADNRMFDIIREFVDGYITDDACSFGLSALDLGKQYVLKSDRAIENMGFLKQFSLCKKEKVFYQETANKNRKKRYEMISDFRSKHRSGKYIEEVLHE